MLIELLFNHLNNVFLVNIFSFREMCNNTQFNIATIKLLRKRVLKLPYLGYIYILTPLKFNYTHSYILT